MLCFIYLLFLKYGVLTNGTLLPVHPTGKHLSMNAKIPPTFLKRTSFLGQALRVKVSRQFRLFVLDETNNKKEEGEEGP